MNKKLLLMCLSLATNSAYAAMYKCSDADGNISFQGTPCTNQQATQWKKETESDRQAADQKALTEARAKVEQQRQQQQVEEAASWQPAGDYTPIKIKIEGQLKNASLYNKEDVSLNDIMAKGDLNFQTLTWVDALKNSTGYKIRLVYQASDDNGIARIQDNVIRTDLEGTITSNKPYEGKRGFEWE